MHLYVTSSQNFSTSGTGTVTKAQMQLLHVTFTNWPLGKLLATYSTGKATTSGQYMFIHKT